MVTKATRDVIDLALRPVLNVDINGGNIDGTVIGITTPDEGYFTNLYAENLTVTGVVDFTGTTILGNFNAYYADVAENYVSDKEYSKGTIMAIDRLGDAEITIASRDDQDVFGVVSSDPAMVLNSEQEGTTLPIALIGRVPVRVLGSIQKGDWIVMSGIDGVGCSSTTRENAIGRSLETAMADYEEEHIVTAVVTIIR